MFPTDATGPDRSELPINASAMTHLLRNPGRRSVLFMLLSLLLFAANVLLLRGLAIHVPEANGWMGILFRGAVGLGLLLALFSHATAARDRYGESEVAVALLYNVTKFVKWPEGRAAGVRVRISRSLSFIVNESLAKSETT